MLKRTTPRTGGRLVADALRVHGTDRVFCVPGESYLEVMDALYDLSQAIALVSCRHESGAAYMAEAYGKLTGRPGVVLVTRGPGACNASIAVHTAFQDSTPLVMLAGQVERAHLGREAFQEVDMARMFAPLAKWAAQIDRADQVPELLARAFHVAVSGRPGPVVLALPEDMLRETSNVPDTGPYQTVQPHPGGGEMARLHGILEGARRPMMILGGGGWTGAAREGIRAFAEANGLPTCCSFRRHDLFDNAHPNFVGELGIGPDPALLARIRDADVVIAVGTRLGEKATQGYSLIDRARSPEILVHVHASAEELGRVYQPRLAIQSGMAAFAEAARALTPVGGERWAEWAADARRDYEANRRAPACDAALDPAAVLAWLDRRLPDDAIVTVDAGNFSGWPQRYLCIRRGQRLLGPIGGAMGYSVPAAVSASLMHPDRLVVGFVGDGSFGMTGNEVATALHYGATPVVVVFNNNMYGTIRMNQESRHPGRVIGTDLINPDFAAWARAFGAFGAVVERTEDFAPAFEEAVAAKRAAVIAVALDPNLVSTRTTLAALAGRAEKGGEGASRS